MTPPRSSRSRSRAATHAPTGGEANAPPDGTSGAFDFMDHIPSPAIAAQEQPPMPAASGTSGRSTTGAFDFLDQIPSLTVAEKEVQQQPNPTAQSGSSAYAFLDSLPSPVVGQPEIAAAEPTQSALHFLDSIPASQRVTAPLPLDPDMDMDVDHGGDHTSSDNEDDIEVIEMHSTPSVSVMAHDVGPVEHEPPSSPKPVIDDLLATATDPGGPVVVPPMFPPKLRVARTEVPVRLLARMEKARGIIIGMMDEIASVRRDLYMISDRLHRIDIVIENTLEKMLTFEPLVHPADTVNAPAASPQASPAASPADS